MAHPNRLQNARVLVFGGTSGIGLGIANMALSNNATVTISGTHPQKVAAKVLELRALYPHLPASHISGLALDLADTENLEKNLTAFFDEATANGTQKIDHVAFTAGDALSLPTVRDVTPETAMRGFKVRFLGASIVAKLLSTHKYMDASTSSSFTLTSGTNTAKPMPGFTFGSAMGGSMEGLVRGLAVDLKPIRVNIVSPGVIETPMLQEFKKKFEKEVIEKAEREGCLLGRFGDVQDTAEAYGYFMRDRYVTGAKVDTDGGRLLV